MSAGRVWSERSAAYAASATQRASGTLEALLALLRPGPNDRCLDIGTGAGHTAARLAEVAGSVIGLDPADGMLDTARALYAASSNLRFVKGSGADSGLATGTFDRLDPVPIAEAEVPRLFRRADSAVRAAFRIRYDAAGEATRFDLPVATVLAVKEE